MSAEMIGTASLVMAVFASLIGLVSIQRHGEDAMGRTARLAEAAGLDPTHAATKNLYDIMAAALTQQTARADAQAARITELERMLYNQSDELRTILVDRDEIKSKMHDRDEEASALKARVRELETVAAQVEQLRAERDRAVEAATAAKAEADEAKAKADSLQRRVEELEARVAIVERHGNA